MADPVRGDLALWSYIQSVYNQINTGRSKFSLGSNITAPSNPGHITTSDISSIKAQIDLFNNNAYVRGDANAQAAINGIIIPTQGTLIRPLSLSTAMDTINNVCIHNATYNSSGYNSSNNSYNSSGYNSSNNSYNSSGYNSSGYNSSNNGYNSSGYNSSNNSYNSSGYNSSNNSYRSSGYNSSNNSYRSSGYNGSYNSSNYSYRSGFKRTR